MYQHRIIILNNLYINIAIGRQTDTTGLTCHVYTWYATEEHKQTLKMHS